ncbi:MAG: DsbA family protein, partial [Candidatus Woesearchaeota archaeon]
VSTFKQYAEDLGLDTEEFNSCLDSGEMADEVSMDMTDGTALGIRGTPGFIINGQLVSGAQPFSVFQQIIESELEG